MPYNFAVLNSPVTGYLGKRIINFGDITETITGISAEEIGKLGLPVSGASHHCFQKRSTFDNSI